MMRTFAVGVLGMMLCLVAPSPAASQEPILSADEVKKLFEGNTELGEGRKDEVDTGRRWTAFYAADGSVRKREAKGDGVVAGTWFVDPEGRACFRWEGWDVAKAPKCDVISRDGDHYLRIRDGQLRGRIQIQEGNPSGL